MPPPGTDKLLFTPGPLSTSTTVKQAMLRDVGSRDGEFIATVADVRERLLRIAGVSQTLGYEAIPLQGSGTFAIEALFASVTPPEGKWLIAANGAYGERMLKIVKTHKIAHVPLRCSEQEPPSADDVDQAIASDPSITGVAVVHCETTTGIVNPIADIGQVARKHECLYFVDSMSAFGAIEFDFAGCGIDFLATSANKCLQGVPGLAIVIARRNALLGSEGCARVVSLDLLEQWRGLEQTGQFRFTPPTHVVLALHQALIELEQEGGVPGRAARYRANHATLVAGMRELGFAEFLPAELQGYIITSFRYPRDPRFDFETFYRQLAERGFVIYPGKVTAADCFRIGTIGHLFPRDVQALLAGIREVIDGMGLFPLPGLGERGA